MIFKFHDARHYFFLRRLIISISLLAIFVDDAEADRLTLENPDDVSSGYSGCSWVDNGDGTTTISATISYKKRIGYPYPGSWNSYKFTSRGIYVYIYNKNGAVDASRSPSLDAATLNGVRWHLRGFGDESAKGAYYGSDRTDNVPPLGGVGGVAWDKMDGLVNVVVSNEAIKDWPAVGIRAANFAIRDRDTQGVRGINFDKSLAYIRYGDSNSICKVVANPENPPPPEIAINMTAPDWSLGDLQRGESEKVFSEAANQLCFTYSGPAVKDMNFVINASNENGVVANRYMLKNVADATQLIPYGITLDSGTSTMSLPNVSNAALPLDSSGKTCFVPTFKTTVDRSVKEGDYSDVLTFTVVTKS